MPYVFGTQYRSGRGVGVGAFSPPRKSQGVPLQPVPMTGQTGMPQGPLWSIADAIMSSTYADDIDPDDWYDDDDDDRDVKLPDWDEWNTPRFDVERFYQVECSACAVPYGKRYYYHGSDKRVALGDYGKPLFLGISPHDVVHYATCDDGSPGVISVVELNCMRPATYDVLLEIVDELGVTPDDVEKFTNFLSDNDYVYVPDVQARLEELGYDAYVNWDPTPHDDGRLIPIVVVWDPAKYSIVDCFDAKKCDIMKMNDEEQVLREFIRRCIIDEVSALSTGAVRGVVTPIGTGPTHPRASDRRGSKRRNKKRLMRSADAFAGGKFVDDKRIEQPSAFIDDIDA